MVRTKCNVIDAHLYGPNLVVYENGLFFLIFDINLSRSLYEIIILVYFTLEFGVIGLIIKQFVHLHDFLITV